jgi:hypothetical protein
LPHYDEVLKLSLEKIGPVDPWLQSNLPVNLGGIGIRHALDITFQAFLGSSHSVSDLVSEILPEEFIFGNDSRVEEAIHEWLLKTRCHVPELSQRGVQKNWKLPLQENKKTKLHENAQTLEDMARLLASSSIEARAWLNVFPSRQLGTHLDNGTFRISVSLRLGSKVCHPHVCRCSAGVDEFGRHGLCCKKSSGRLFRHETVNDLIKRALFMRSPVYIGTSWMTSWPTVNAQTA